jgi:hypothetical protein
MATVNTKGEKMVKIRLFKDNRSYNDDVVVGVNGRMFQIQRGVEVEVPECVAEVLRNSEKQDQHAITLMGDLQQGASW